MCVLYPDTDRRYGIRRGLDGKQSVLVFHGAAPDQAVHPDALLHLTGPLVLVEAGPVLGVPEPGALVHIAVSWGRGRGHRQMSEAAASALLVALSSAALSSKLRFVQFRSK